MAEKRLKVIILGAGPAGLLLASRLLERDDLNLEISVIEREGSPGGIAASFQEENIWLDYGSHRLHPATPAHLLNELKTLLGTSLLQRKRNGKIHLQGRYLQFPLKPIDCLLHLPPSFMVGVSLDLIKKPFRPKKKAESFKEHLLQGLGATVCNRFYFPYAQKLWGCPPETIDIIQAHKRVSAGTISKIVRKMAAFLPFIPQKNSGIFYYPVKGIGQIAEALAEKVTQDGGHIFYKHDVTAIVTKGHQVTSITMENSSKQEKLLEADFVFSTIPLTRTATLCTVEPDTPVQDAIDTLHSRNMVFLYLVMECGQWQPVDAHYFPEEAYIFSRISEGKNYNNAHTPVDKTIICCEIPCSPGDAIWRVEDEVLQRMVTADMEKAGIPARNLLRVFSKRKANVYPVYSIGYPQKLTALQEHLKRFTGLICLGRQGLFTHDNIHHTMMMADKAAQCIGTGGKWDGEKWEMCCEEFSSYVVED